MDFFKILSQGATLNKKRSSDDLPPRPSSTPGVKAPSPKKKKRKKKRGRSSAHPRGDSIGSESDLRLSTLSPVKNTATSSSTSSSASPAAATAVSSPSAQQLYDEVAAFRRRLSIHIHTSVNCPRPMATFDLIRPPSSSPLTPKLLANVENSNWVNPTPCQMQAIPSLLALRDTLLCAPTGSGKTAAFMIPALLLSSLGEKRANVRSIVLEPTRELCEQVKRVALSLGRGGGVKVMVLSKENAHLPIPERGIDVLISTPFRLTTFFPKMDTSSLKIVCLDEADRLLDDKDAGGAKKKARADAKKLKKARKKAAPKEAGSDDGDSDDSDSDSDSDSDPQSAAPASTTYLGQISAILPKLPPTCVRSYSTATLSPHLRSLALTSLRNPVQITVGGSTSGAAAANSDVKQSLKFVGKEEGKILAMRQLLRSGVKPPVLVFVQDKKRAKGIYDELKDETRIELCTSDLTMAQRDEAVTRFRTGQTWFLVCTDSMSRGLDFPAVQVVINYDFPQSTISYVHRIGRAGRAGRTGEAITLFTEDDYPALRGVANIIKLSGGEVQDWMLKLKKERHSDKKKREAGGARRRGS